MYLCGPGKHNCQPFCGPEGRFYCSDSVCSLWPAPFSYLCVSVMILCVCWKLSAAEQVKTDCCHTPAVVSTLLTPLPVSCPLTTPHHYNSISNSYMVHICILIRQRADKHCDSSPFFAFCNTSCDLLPKYVSTSLLLRVQFYFFMPSLIFLMSHFEQSSQNNHSWKPNHLQDYTNSILGRKLHWHWHSTVFKNSLAGKGLNGHWRKDGSYYYYYWSLLYTIYSTILRSRADSLHSHVILHEWIAFHSTFFEYPPKWCT